MTIGSCRAYFRLQGGLKCGQPTSTGINNFVLNFGDGETTTGIVKVDNGNLKDDGFHDGWFMLDGRKLPGKPTQKGIYIHNGLKIVNK